LKAAIKFEFFEVSARISVIILILCLMILFHFLFLNKLYFQQNFYHIFFDNSD